QPPPVDHLEQRRVAEPGQPPLAPRPRRFLHMIIGGVEERLQLGPGQRPPSRPALVLPPVRRGVPLVEHLPRHRPAPLPAPPAPPPIPRTPRAPQEPPPPPPRRRARGPPPPPGSPPPPGLPRRPLPRPAPGERGELAPPPLPLADQPGGQPAGLLLPAPPRQHL